MLKCPPFARIHARRRLRHSLVASLMLCSSHAPCRRSIYTASVHQRHELSSGRAAAAFLPKLCSQPGSDLTVRSHRSGVMKAGDFHSRRLIVSRSRCARTLSCCKIKNSPEITHNRQSKSAAQHGCMRR